MSERVIDMRSKNKDWISTKIDLSKPISPPEPLLIQTETNIPLLYRRGIHVSSGKQKAGKTFYNSILMSAVLNPQGYCGLKPVTLGLKVLFADTEQDKSDTQEVIKRVHRLNGWVLTHNVDRLVGINLREYSAPERINLIEQAIQDVNPDILVIDGVVDLCLDFNSLEEGHALTTLLMQWIVKYNVSIITSLHTNKGNNELRGHLGAFLAQKGESVMRVTKKTDGLSYMACEIIESRHKPIDDFDFRIVEGLPEPYSPSGSNKALVNYEDIFEKALGQGKRYGELVSEVVKIAGVADATAKRYIRNATELGIIKNKNGYYECENTLPF